MVAGSFTRLSLQGIMLFSIDRQGFAMTTEFGQRIYLSGLKPETTDDDIRQLFRKYTQHEPSQIERVDGDSAVLMFEQVEDGELQLIAGRIDTLFWHGHTVGAKVL